MPYIPGANRFVSHTVLGLLFKATPLHIRDQLKNPKPGFLKSMPYIPGANRFDPHTCSAIHTAILQPAYMRHQ
jgi:hypothetical protein